MPVDRSVFFPDDFSCTSGGEGTLTKRDFGGRLALLLAAMIWGSAFFVMKNAVDVIPTWMLLGIRFTMGAMVLGAVFFRRLRKLRASTWLRGAALGVLLCAAYGVQTFGLMETTPGKNAFLTTVYCILVPFLGWAALGKRPTGYNALAAVLCLGGIGLVSLTGDFSMGRGDLLTLVSGVIYAAHILALGRFSRGEDTALLTLTQFAAAALMAWVLSLATETAPSALPAGAMVELAYLGVFSTALALLMQSVGQKITPPAPAAILLSLESVFGVLFSVLFYGEVVTPRLGAGFALIFLAVVVSETQLAFLRPLSARRRRCASGAS